MKNNARRLSRFLLATRWRQAALCGLACLLFMGCLRAYGVLDGLSMANYDFLLRSRGALYPHPKIKLLVIDDDTINTYGAFPPPRQMYADVLKRLDDYGARTVAFDVLFSTHSDPQQDKALIEASRQADHVVHAVSFILSDQSKNRDPYSATQAYAEGIPPNPRFQISSSIPLNYRGLLSWAEANRLTAKQAKSALPELQRSAGYLGHINAPADLDGKLRSVPHVFFTFEKEDQQSRLTGIYPSLSLAAATAYLGKKPGDVVFTPESIQLAGRTIPVDSRGRTRVNWVGGPNAYPTFSVAAFLGKGNDKAQVPSEAFKDSIVIVGFTAAGAYEHRPTPFAGQQAAVEMQASALDNILTYRFLHEAAAWVPLVLMLLFCLLGCMAIVWRGALAGTLLTVGAVLIAWCVSLVLIRVSYVYLPIAIPAISGIISCAVFTLFLQLQDTYLLKMAEERYALAVNGANDGLWDWNLITKDIYFSPRWINMLGRREDEVGSTWRDWSNLIHPDDLEQVKLEIKAHLNGQSAHFENEHRMLHRDGTYRWVLSRGLAVRNEQGRPSRMAGSMSDIHDRKIAEEQIRHDAIHDGLTELPNRTLFNDRLSQAIGRSRSQPDFEFAVLFLDLDRFKVVNDSLGHSIGDELLKEVSQRLKVCLRPGDTAARLGGDEFTILLESLRHTSDATRIADNIQQELSRPFTLFDTDGVQHEVFVTASIGIAINQAEQTYVSSPSTKHEEGEEIIDVDVIGEISEEVVEDGLKDQEQATAQHSNGADRAGFSKYQTPEELLRNADTAMYRAKALGPAQHAVFDEAMHSKAMTMLQLQTDLRHAVEREEFEPYFQPIVSLETGLISSFEALVRWNHPTRGFISPANFVPMAEETGLVVQLDQLVLRAACEQAMTWQNIVPAHLEPPTISVNLSVQQFWQNDLVERVEKVLADTGLSPRRLKLEITESAIMRNAESAIAMLRQLQNLGIALSIDDFGTGYSSLAYLQKFPLDTLKIDQSFVRAIGTEDESSEIVWTIIALARNLGMDVIAEGVETLEHLAQLKRLTCDYGQGYYFSRPIPAAEAQTMVKDISQWEKTVLREANFSDPNSDMGAELADLKSALSGGQPSTIL